MGLNIGETVMCEIILIILLLAIPAFAIADDANPTEEQILLFTSDVSRQDEPDKEGVK